MANEPESERATGRGDLGAYLALGAALTAMGLSSKQWVLIVPTLAALALHPLLKWRFSLGYMSYLLLALPVSILSNANEVDGNSGLGFFNMAFYIAYYLQWCAVLQLYKPRPDAMRLPIAIACSSLGIAACGTDIPSQQAYLGVIAVYAAGMLDLLRAGIARAPGPERGRALTRFAVGAAFLLTFLCSFAMVALINNYYNQLNNLLRSFAIRVSLLSAPGFGDTASLGSISNLHDAQAAKRIAIRAYGQTAPGYLRGRVYLTYGSGKWSCNFSSTEIDPWQIGKRAAAGEKKSEKRYARWSLPGKPPAEEFAPVSFRAYPEETYAADFFLPLSACTVETTSQKLVLRAGNTLSSKYRPTSRGYGAVVNPDAPAFEPNDPQLRLPYATTEGVHPQYLNVPPGATLRAELRKVLEKAGRDQPYRRDDAASLVRSLQRYFDKHYYYKFGIHFETAEPMIEWLGQTTPDMDHGHCELFASAGTLLLRSEGIPARYVTGFVCTEKNPYSDMWVARNRDAHAWVEYFDRKRGWQIAEFTPPGGLPDPEPPAGNDALGEYLSGLWQQLKGFILREGFAGLMELLGYAGLWLIATWPRRIVVFLIVFTFLLHRYLRARRRDLRFARPPREFPADLARQREEYLRLEKRLKRLGLARRGEETLDEYAARLQTADLPDRDAAAEFIRRYAAARYTPF